MVPFLGELLTAPDVQRLHTNQDDFNSHAKSVVSKNVSRGCMTRSSEGAVYGRADAMSYGHNGSLQAGVGGAAGSPVWVAPAITQQPGRRPSRLQAVAHPVATWGCSHAVSTAVRQVTMASTA
ncbi:hypothetical protein Agub_g4234 [Astrephomene gubernaculifera]|uniref:Uncharacterized protein n=1 Tax=Astrephomene gubernaculifera TaxID=47775 RepID=A0AAD3DJV4_9CHLO|nr:hypothetical protein Agub_g4234 [Astrephomene gubernaculifera]